MPRRVPVPTTGVGAVRAGEWCPGFRAGDVCLRIDAVAPGSPAAVAGLAGHVRALVPGLEMTFDEGPRGAARNAARAARRNEGAVDRFAWQRGSTAP